MSDCRRRFPDLCCLKRFVVGADVHHYQELQRHRWRSSPRELSSKDWTADSLRHDGAREEDRQVATAAARNRVFKITPGGTLTTLHEFVGADGSYPYAGLVLATDGNFYGSAPGGAPDGGAVSTAFEITPGGTLTILSSSFGFRVQSQDTSLVQDTVNGDFYGIRPPQYLVRHGHLYFLKCLPAAA